MLLQLIYEEESGLNQMEEYGYGQAETKPLKSKKIKPPRKNKFTRRFRDNNEVKPRQGEPLDESETGLCTAVWRSVVIQAMYDLSGTGGSVERRVIRAESSSWFAENPEGESDFETVCEMAELDPVQVRKVAKKVREDGLDLNGYFNFRSVRREFSTRVGRKNKTLKIKE